MDEKEKLLAKMLKSRRGELGISMSEVVDALAKSGININEKTLYGYENAVSRPSIRTFRLTVLHRQRFPYARQT